MTTHRLRSPYSRLLALWVLRAFAPNLGRCYFIKNTDFADADIAEFLGLSRNLEMEKIKSIFVTLDRLQNSLENSGNVSLSALARRNIAKIASAINLNTTEERILEFFACMAIEAPLSDSWRVLSHLTYSGPTRFLSKVLKLSQHSVIKALSSNGRLMKCGLLKRSKHRDLNPIEFHSSVLARLLLRNIYEPSKILKAFGVVTPSVPELGLKDFPHLQTSMDLLLPYLKNAMTMKKSGVNVLVHGDPGTGKTQLARVLARHLGIQVFELDTSDNAGDPHNPERRLATLNLAQAYFNETPVLLVFDEAEDILTPSP